MKLNMLAFPADRRSYFSRTYKSGFRKNYYPDTSGLEIRKHSKLIIEALK